MNRSFASPIRFFSSDDIDGIKEAIRLALRIMASNAKSKLDISLIDNSVKISIDGEPMNLDFDEENQIWGYNKIFNHALNIIDEEHFGLANNEEKLTLVQLVSEFFEVNVVDAEFCLEYKVRFENGSVTNKQTALKSSYCEDRESGNSIYWKFDPSLFLVNDLPNIDFFQRIVSDCAKKNPGMKFSICKQIPPNYAEKYSIVSHDGFKAEIDCAKLKG